jgi:hypothetical protein
MGSHSSFGGLWVGKSSATAIKQQPNGRPGSEFYQPDLSSFRTQRRPATCSLSHYIDKRLRQRCHAWAHLPTERMEALDGAHRLFMRSPSGGPS